MSVVRLAGHRSLQSALLPAAATRYTSPTGSDARRTRWLRMPTQQARFAGGVPVMPSIEDGSTAPTNMQFQRAEMARKRREYKLAVAKSRRAKLADASPANESKTGGTPGSILNSDDTAEDDSPDKPSHSPSVKGAPSIASASAPWSHDIPPASPMGKLFSRTLGDILRKSAYKDAITTSTGETYFLPCLLCLSAFPKLVYAYERAGVRPKTHNLTVLLFRFPSAPDTLYCVSTTEAEGAYAILMKKFKGGLRLSRGNIACGSQSAAHHEVDIAGILAEGEDSSDVSFSSIEGRYGYINRFCCLVNHGPTLWGVKGFNADQLLAYELDTNVNAPRASMTGEIFEWGGDTNDYIRPAEGAAESGGTSGRPIGDFGGNIFNPLACLKEENRLRVDGSEEGDDADDVDRALSGRASMLHYRDRETAHRMYKAEKARNRETIEKFRSGARAQLANKVNPATGRPMGASPSLDSI